MAIKLTEESTGNLLDVEVTDKLHKDDYRNFVPEFERLVKKHGRVRILFDMKDFHGWDAPTLWHDIRFGVQHSGDIDRIAMVGDKAWEKAMSAFCRPFTNASIRYFDHTEINDARSWLAAD
ncbi:MAG TPA: STAS/SEC14 domain-containing protein [Chthoniobacterales bacterium]